MTQTMPAPVFGVSELHSDNAHRLRSAFALIAEGLEEGFWKDPQGMLMKRQKRCY